MLSSYYFRLLHGRNVHEKGGQVPILSFWKGCRLKIQMWVQNQLPTSCCTVSTCTGIIGDVLLPTCTATLFDCERSQENLPYQRSWEAWEHPLMLCSLWIQQMHGFICHLVLVSGLSPVNDSVYLHQIQVSAPVYESPIVDLTGKHMMAPGRSCGLLWGVGRSQIVVALCTSDSIVSSFWMISNNRSWERWCKATTCHWPSRSGKGVCSYKGQNAACKFWHQASCCRWVTCSRSPCKSSLRMSTAMNVHRALAFFLQLLSLIVM